MLILLCLHKANPLPHGLDKIPDAQGYLVINSDGAVLAVSVYFPVFSSEMFASYCKKSFFF